MTTTERAMRARLDLIDTLEGAAATLRTVDAAFEEEYLRQYVTTLARELEAKVAIP